jgi:hypothetical protein
MVWLYVVSRVYVPGLRTARHSSGVRSSGYDVMVFLVLDVEVPKRALRSGMDGIDLSVVLEW